ncbi:MAG: DUF2147 domain-containing protein [Pseudomonadota bacterium]
MRYFILIALLFVSVPTYAQDVFNPEGLWLTENERSVIKVEKCGEAMHKLCGSIHWIIEGGMQKDSKNPDESKRNQPMCGLQIIKGLKQSPYKPNIWRDGEIYKADDGDTYDAKIEMVDENTMELRGYMSISLLGKSQTWTRVDAKKYPRCQ